MSTGALTGSTAGLTASTTPSMTAGDPYSSMTSKDFVKVMLSELKHQDPTNPTDTSKIMSELSSLRNIESQMSLQTNLKDLVSQNQIAQAAGMIGKLVSGMDSNGNKMAGHVMSIKVVNGNAMLQLDSGQSLDMNNVTTIEQA